ncbi:hypothetical protein SDC9_94669 [bioreactor metagenome]|uniref:Uncharacterized protein n=1 Tax=bioreactor metagenome TaxID=1076179 RepID=A0A645A5H3_9ZZZZ
MILVDGRKEKVEGFAPLKNDLAAEVVSDFDRLWNRVFGSQKTDPGIKLLKLKMRMTAQSLKLTEE